MVLMIREGGARVAVVAALHVRSVESELSICGQWPRRSILIVCWSQPAFLRSRARGAYRREETVRILRAAESRISCQVGHVDAEFLAQPCRVWLPSPQVSPSRVQKLAGIQSASLHVFSPPRDSPTPDRPGINGPNMGPLLQDLHRLIDVGTRDY